MSKKSKYVGVWPTLNGRYRAGIVYNQTRTHLGIYDSEEEAARAYDSALLHLQSVKPNGVSSKPNLPDSRPRSIQDIRATAKVDAGEAVLDLPGEEWRPVQGWESYQVSDMGRLVNTAGGVRRLRRGVPGCKTGQIIVTLSRDGRHKTVSLRSLVARAFMGDPPGPGMKILLVDGNKRNLAISNMRWATQREINLHGIANGTRKVIPKGQMVCIRKLSDEDKAQMLLLWGQGRTQTEIARMFNCDNGHVSRILKRARERKLRGPTA